MPREPREVRVIRESLERMDRRVAIAICLVILMLLFVIQAMKPLASLHGAQLVAEPDKAGVELYVAIGTGAAAIFTAVSAFATAILAWFTWGTLQTSVVATEDERNRHRQSLAPVIEIVPLVEQQQVADIVVRNVGPGIAQQVFVEVKGFYVRPDGSIEEISRSSARSILPNGDVWHEVIPELMGTVRLRQADRVAVVAAVTYRDMFNNTYYTITQDVMKRGEMEWVRPKTIYRERSRFENLWADKQDMDNVIQVLEYNGPLSRDGSP